MRWLPNPAKSVLTPEANIPVFETIEDISFEKSHWAIWLTPDSPRKEYGIALVNALYKEIQKLASSKSASFFVFDFDWFSAINNVQLTTGKLNAVKAAFFLPSSKYLKWHDQYFLAGGKDEYFKVSSAVNSGIPFLMAKMDLGEDPYVSEEDLHLNEEGNTYLLKQIADKVIRMLNGEKTNEVGPGSRVKTELGEQ